MRLAALAGLLALTGCGTATSPPRSAPSGSASAASSAHAGVSAVRPSVRHRHRSTRATPRSPGLAYSSASAQVIQPQPSPGSCHAHGSGLYSRPDPRCTPGALDPAVTQATIAQTICVEGWTSTVRPPEAVTEVEKRASMAAYGDSGSPGQYEYDHFVPLELGGAVNDPRNLWPEPGASPNPKDAVEDSLRQQVCDGTMSLAAARRAIVADWIRLVSASVPAFAPAPASAPAASSSDGAGCSVSASYSTRYDDYDVYVQSHQPAQTVTVSDAAGRTKHWHTDAAGSADVYFDAPASAAGETITVQAGSATCTATL